MIIYENNDNLTKLIGDNATFFLVNNCYDYDFCNDTNNRWILQTYENSIEYENVYLLIDTYINDALAHWVFESLVYLRLYARIKQMYPSIKIVFKTKKDYKLLFCKHFNILEENIAYSISSDKPNLCLIPQPITALNYRVWNDINKELINNFFFEFTPIDAVSNESEYLIMPRQTKENCTDNDAIVQLLITIQYFNENNIKNNVLHTDEITDLSDQINMLSQHKNIILVDGSALLVNGMLCKNKKIYVVGRLCTQYQSERYVKYKYILDCIQNINKNIIYYYNTEEEFCNYMSSIK